MRRHHQKIAEQKWSILRCDAAHEIRRSLDWWGDGTRSRPRNCFLEAELDYWEGVLDSDELSPQPIILPRFRWMRNATPATARPKSKASYGEGGGRKGEGRMLRSTRSEGRRWMREGDSNERGKINKGEAEQIDGKKEGWD